MVLGPLIHLGTLFLEGPQGLVPSTSGIISPALYPRLLFGFMYRIRSTCIESRHLGPELGVRSQEQCRQNTIRSPGASGPIEPSHAYDYISVSHLANVVRYVAGVSEWTAKLPAAGTATFPVPDGVVLNLRHRPQEPPPFSWERDAARGCGQCRAA